MYHIPVLLEESIEALNIKPNGIYIDCTFGGGGHSKAILDKLDEEGKLYGFDQDIEAYNNALDDPRFTFVRGNFKHIRNFIQYYGHTKVDGILADLGISSHHFDEAKRGFSYRFDAPLDMRMNQKSDFTAQQLINTYTHDQIADILYQYGEIRNSKKIANAIIQKREVATIDTIFQLVDILKPLCAKHKEYKELAPIFQAIRIEINGELEALKTLLVSSVDLLNPTGRIAIISYHSLEDRLVKNFFKTGNFSGVVQKDFYGRKITPLQNGNSKVIVSTQQENDYNSRARSAKLRFAEKQ